MLFRLLKITVCSVFVTNSDLFLRWDALLLWVNLGFVVECCHVRRVRRSDHVSVTTKVVMSVVILYKNAK